MKKYFAIWFYILTIIYNLQFPYIATLKIQLFAISLFQQNFLNQQLF